MSRPASRRGILAALAVAPAIVPAAALPQPISADAAAYALFDRWWAAYEYASELDLTDEEPDPVFAALVAEGAAEDRFVAASTAWTDGPTGFYAALKPAADEAGDAYYATLRATMATVPTTTAGLLALVNRFEVTIEGCEVSAEHDGLTELLATVRAFVGGRA